ncbi:hypothetical protein B0H13DRAFT_1891546 [Mycena leptocephala]|nr:hypothetical protein B0H13DRAFT_1891546 [Mycena leptocephala]
MSGDKPWSLHPRKSDGLAATSIASGYVQAPKKKSSTSARVSSGSSVSYIDSGSGSGSEDDDLPDPATLLASVPSKSAKSKVRKRSVDAMDVDEEPAAPPNKKANRAGKGGSAVSNAAETPLKAKERPLPRPKFSGACSTGDRNVDSRRTAVSPLVGRPTAQPSSSSTVHPRTRTIDLDKIKLEEALRIDDSFDFEINRSELSGISRMYEFAIQDAEEIGRTYKPLEVKDPATFRKTMDYFSMPGFALSRTGEWLHSNGGSLPELVMFYNTLHIILVTVRYRYGAIDPMEPLPSDPNHQIFFDGRDPQPRWKHYTREVFPPFDGQRHLVMNKVPRKFAEHEASENGKEAAFTARQKASYSEWEERACIYREKIPEVHKHQLQRILEYIGLRQKVLGDIEHRLNTLGCYILFRIRAQFDDEDCALGSGFSAPSSQPPYRPPLAPSTRRRQRLPRAAAERLSWRRRPSPFSRRLLFPTRDDEPLSASRDAKSKGKGKIIVVPKPSSKKKAAERASSECAASDHAESDEGEQSDGEEEDPITRSVKVKKGRKTVQFSEWHAANDLFVYAWPTTASGNKIVTHGYPFDEKHPQFSATWKHQITLASLPVHAFFTRGRPSSFLLGVRAVLLGTEQLYSPALWGEPRPGCATAARITRPAFAARSSLMDVTDAALPRNAEYFELQQALMLDIAEEVAPAGTTSASLASYSVNFACLVRGRPNGGASRSLRGRLCRTPRQPLRVQVERRVHAGGMTKGSATEVDEKVEDEENAAMPPASESGVSNEGPPPSRARASLDVDAPAALPLRLSLGAPDSASLRPPSDPVQLFSPAVPSRRSNTPDRARRASSRLVRPYRRVLDARPDSSIFGKPGPVLGGNSSETSEESASVTFRWVKRTQRARSRARESSRARRGGGEMNVD